MKVRLLVLATSLTLTLASCGGSSEASGGGADVGFSVAKLTDQFQVLMVQRVEDQAGQQDVALLPVVNANGDPAKQNEDINTLLTRGVKGLIVGPIDSKAIVPAIKKANTAKVPVVTIDSGADGGDIAMTVKADNRFMGAAACKSLGDLVGGKGTVLNLQGALSSTNGRDRSNGFTTCMDEKYPNIKVISKPFDWSSEKCASVAQTVLSTEDIDGIYTASEIGCLQPVASALKAVNRYAPVGDPKHVPFVGIDGSPESMQAIQDGYMDAVVSQPLNAYAQWAVYWVDRAIKGEPTKEGPTDHNSIVVKEGSSYLDLLESPVVTKQTVDDPNLWGNG